ncbi:MAG: hypothetical protein KYX64_08980 [Sphingopyxis sp.]|nr:hypothetical protein [Sphingopyxis sp.]
MIMRLGAARRNAPALRFLLLCIGGWIFLRTAMVWNPAPALPDEAIPPPGRPLSPFAATAEVSVGASRGDVARPSSAALRRPSLPSAYAKRRRKSADGLRATGGRRRSEPTGADGPDLRLALAARPLPPSFLPVPVAEPTRGQGKPFWIQRPLAGWSLSSWMYLREGSARAPGPIGAASQLGGSQAGLRLAYGFGDTGRLRAYGRATIAMQRTRQREVAVGLAFAPAARLPIDISVEQRVAVGREGRTALAVMASGGVSDVRLPAGFRLDAYAQAGVVGARRRDGFADGAIVVDRPLGADESMLRIGALVAGAVQPGAARVDVGPRLTLRLPDVGAGSRIAIDWRQRIAGGAQPDSGLALTLAADF